MYFLFPLFLEQLYFFCSQFFYRKFNGEREGGNKRLFDQAISSLPAFHH